MKDNFGHISCHVMECKGCPPEVKQALWEMKKEHRRLQHSLPHGSTQEFFDSIWERLHKNDIVFPTDNDEDDFGEETSLGKVAKESRKDGHDSD